MENEQVTTKSPIDSASLQFLTSDEAVSSQRQSTADIINRAEEIRSGGTQAAKAARDAQTQSIDANFTRELENQQRTAQNARTSFAQGSAMGTSTSQYRVLSDTINENLADLRSRKQEAELNNNAEYLAQINAQEMQYLETKQKATQTLFNNMLGIAGLQQKQQSFRLQERRQAFAEESQIGEVALEFGLDIEDGESLDSIIAKAAPKVNEMRGLEKREAEARLNQIQETIKTSRAQRAEIQRKANDANALGSYLDGLSDDDMKALIATGQIGVEELSSTGNTRGLGMLADTSRNDLRAQSTEQALQLYQNGSSKQDVIDTLQYDNPTLTEAEAILIANESDPTSDSSSRQGSTLVGDLSRLGTSIGNVGIGLGEYYGGYSPEEAERLRGTLYGQ